MYTDYVQSFTFTQTQLSDGTTVHVSASWILGSLSADALEVYYGFDSDDSLPGPPRLTVLPPDTKSPVTLTVPSLGKPAILYLWLAPRLIDSETNQAKQMMPDTEDDDHEWDLYAALHDATISYTPVAANSGDYRHGRMTSENSERSEPFRRHMRGIRGNG